MHTHTSIVPCTRIRGDEGQIPKHYVRKLGESYFRHLFPKMQTGNSEERSVRRRPIVTKIDFSLILDPFSVDCPRKSCALIAHAQKLQTKVPGQRFLMGSVGLPYEVLGGISRSSSRIDIACNCRVSDSLRRKNSGKVEEVSY